MGKEEILHLPSEINVNVFMGTSGEWIVEIPKYDLIAQSDSLLEVDYWVNELICVHFGIPKKIQGFIRYVPKKLPQQVEGKSKTSSKFEKFVSPLTFTFA